MPLHHYIAATFLATFSYDKNERRRERSLWIADKREGRIFGTSAQHVCAIHDFYTIPAFEWPSDAVDRSLSGFEPTLHIAISDLINGTLDGLTWAGILVPFVASPLVRGPDFNERYEDRIENNVPGISKYFGTDRLRANTNFSRLMERQRLLMPIAGAQWRLLETGERHTQITNDMAYAISFDQRTREFGIAIPVGHRHILHIIPTARRVIAYAKEAKWWPTVERFELDDNQHDGLLRSIADQARRFIIGPDEKSVRRYAIKEPRPARSLEPDELGFIDAAQRRKWEMGYFSLLSKLSASPPPDGSMMRLDLGRDPT
jgi:hypothetical protein